MAAKGYFEVHLQDEVPRFGCGRRVVAVDMGRKWVHLWSPALNIKGRVPREMFKRLNPIKVNVRAKYRKRRK